METRMAQADLELVITRDFAAPRELVWKVWNEPAHIEKWFGPKGFTTKVKSQDFVTGGKWDYVMIGPDGDEFPFNGVFIEITPIEKVVSPDEFGEKHTEKTTE